jgi:uncharacterized protein YqiB (DUF1249 family)
MPKPINSSSLATIREPARLPLSASLKVKSYVPDLSAFISLCDANYAKLMQLLPLFEKQNTRSFGLSRNEHDLGSITISILERCKYTTMLSMQQLSTAQFDLLTTPNMQVRLYHDASMAEVMSFQGISKLKPNYQYPNKQMHQKDEKALCNEFLADWLSYCLKFGHSLEGEIEKIGGVAETRGNTFREESSR